jgi:spore maturation protein CgeB
VANFNLEDRMGFYTQAYIERHGELVKAFETEAAVSLAAKGIEAACYEFLPDVVFVISCFFVPLELLDLCRARGSKVVILHLEEPYEFDRELERAAHADLNFINDPTHLDEFREVAPTHYMPHAYRPALHHPGPPEPNCISDFCFVGTGFPSRTAFFEAVDWDGIDIALAGNWRVLAEDSPLRKHLAHDIFECCPNDEAVRLYRSTRASANFYRREVSVGGSIGGWSMGPREVELAATGTFFLTEARGENRRVLPMVPTFTGHKDFEEQLRWWLARPEPRQAITEAARAAISERTFHNHAAELLRLIEKGVTHG